MITMPLTKGQSAVIDDEDADLLTHSYWACETTPGRFYAKRHTRVGTRRYSGRYLHRDVAERAYGPIPKGMDVDHINHDTLDCRRENLRVVPRRVNVWNQNGAGKDSRSGIRGVRQTKAGRWVAYICEGRKMKHLGTFDEPEAAQAARLAAEALREVTHGLSARG